MQQKKLWLGTSPAYSNVYGKVVPQNVFAQVDWDGRKLSIGGSWAGGSGQIVMSYLEGHMPITPAPGWTKETVEQFFMAWDEWHLNDTNACTVEMKAAGWRELAATKMHGYEFRLMAEVTNEQRRLKANAEAALMRGEAVQHDERSLETLRMPYDYKQWVYATEPEPQPRQHYERAKDLKGNVKSADIRTLGWLHPSEHYKRHICEDVHPDGLLTRKLGEHGYGSAWYFHEVPADVIAFLMSLPNMPPVVPVWTPSE